MWFVTLSLLLLLLILTLEASSFEEFLAYIYTGNVQLTGSNILYLLHYSTHYDLPELQEVCTKSATSELNPKIAINLMLAADQLGKHEIVEKCIEVICSTPDECFQSESFPQIPPSLLIDIIDRNELEIAELTLFERLIVWMEKNSSSTEEKLKVFTHVRYPLIPAKDLVRIVAPTKLAPPELYMPALEYHIDVCIFLFVASFVVVASVSILIYSLQPEGRDLGVQSTPRTTRYPSPFVRTQTIDCSHPNQRHQLFICNYPRGYEFSVVTPISVKFIEVRGTAKDSDFSIFLIKNGAKTALSADTYDTLEANWFRLGFKEPVVVSNGDSIVVLWQGTFYYTEDTSENTKYVWISHFLFLRIPNLHVRRQVCASPAVEVVSKNFINNLEDNPYSIEFRMGIQN